MAKFRILDSVVFFAAIERAIYIHLSSPKGFLDLVTKTSEFLFAKNTHQHYLDTSSLVVAFPT